MTLDEIARELGVSKSTVSRALSGKGRIGERTRERIVAYAGEQGRRLPGTPQEDVKTGNLGVVFPVDVYENANSYFQDCLLGICEAASFMDFNVLIAMGTASDISGVRALAEKRKVDGIIHFPFLCEGPQRKGKWMGSSSPGTWRMTKPCNI